MTNRLTYETPDGKIKPVKSIDETVYNRAGYVVTGSKIVEKLAGYEGAEEQGHLFTAPVAVGGTVWRIVGTGIKSYVVQSIKFGDNGLYRLIIGASRIKCLSDNFGIEWWVAKEDAVKALEERSRTLTDGVATRRERDGYGR